MASTTSSTRTRRPATRRVATQPATPETATAPAPTTTVPAVLSGVVQPTGTNSVPTGPRFVVVPEGDHFRVTDKGKTLTPTFSTAEAAQAAIDLLIAMKPEKVSVKAEAVKANARRDLAHLLVQAYATAFASLPDDSPILSALGKAEAAQDAANWIHHLPIVDTGAEWDIVGLPAPKRSNWDGKIRK